MSLPSATAYDLVVVGSGPTGSTYVREVYERHPTARILLLDAGPRLTDPPGTHVKNIPDPGERARAQRDSEGPGPAGRPGTRLLGSPGLPAAALSTNVGGMGAHWTGACPRPGDGERVGFIPDAEMDAHLTRAEQLLHVDAHAFDHAPFADEVRRRLSALIDSGRPAHRRVGPMPLAVTPRADGAHIWSGTDVVLGGAVADERVEITDRCLGLRVVMDGDTAAGVVVRDMVTGEETTVAARAVVVAADALRTPQLLYASGIRPPALGRYLNDQPQIVYAVRLPDDVVAAHRAVTGRTRDEDGAIVPQSGVSWVPYTDAHPFHGQVMQLDASPVPLAGDVDVEPGTVVGLGWFCAKDITPDDRIEFTDTEADAYGLPAMRIHYRYSDRDLATIEQAKKAVAEAGAAVGIPLDDSPLLLPAGSSLHYQGTTRMGPADDGTSVCDSHSRVWNTRGLWIAGNNVIPTATACNPTLTSVALAVRGAHALLDHLASLAGRSTPTDPAGIGTA
ncbi:choline dehydrogenase [Streptomyces sp. Ru73]|uniref:GMC oxidoreductase n=1 Tax=Streptomyces sp. Ru73 TaxID=2080748 RepID=UPI000CDD4EDF|nr:GMC oxidoreductase [Streptomyces sp. Ru73]POX38237.1 choline dehydrogenase [Streptomyces sp. Ru73]